MKSTLYDSKGEKISEISLPSVFSIRVRQDLAAKYFEANKFEQIQPYSTYSEAGKRHSASGTISHQRHKWKGHYGKGISRLPRKTMWRRGTQFFWIGAEVSQTRGGRVAHPPEGLHSLRKINQKERKIAIFSGLASSFSEKLIKERYSSLNAPVVSAIIESLPQKSKSLLLSVKNIFGEFTSNLVRNKEVRAGKGKRRGRKYKSNAGLLIIKSPDENLRSTLFTIRTINTLAIRDVYPLGRIILYTKKAVDEINSFNASKEQSSKKNAVQIKQEGAKK